MKVPEQRRIAGQFSRLPLDEIEKLLHNSYHECRMTALFILVDFFQKGSNAEKEAAVNLYLGSMQYINNWDLVDLSCYKILGPWLDSGTGVFCMTWLSPGRFGSSAYQLLQQCILYAEVILPTVSQSRKNCSATRMI